MTTLSLLRKTFDNGYISTWRFAKTFDGQYVATSNRGERKHFATIDSMRDCADAFIGFGYQERTQVAAPVKVTKTEEAPAETVSV